MPTIDDAKQATLELICDIDAVRIQHGVAPLHWDWKLWWMAQKMATDLAGASTFSHIDPDGSDLYDRALPVGYLNDNSDGFLLENLAWARGYDSPPLAVVLSWLDSPGHRANLLNPELQHLGIGIAEGAPTPGGDSGLFYVVDFGRQGVVMSELVVTPQPHRRPASCSRLRRAHRGQETRKRGSRRIRCTASRSKTPS